MLSAERQEQRMAAAVAVALDDAPTRLMLLTRLVAKIESGDAVQDLLRAGLDHAAIQQLRGMSISDALQVANTSCGLAIQLQPRELHGQLGTVERAKRLRDRLEYFIKNGASPRLLMQLFRISPGDARRMRKQLAPAIATGGRTREPTESERSEISEAWSELLASCPDDCDRVWMLHQRFTTMWIASLELVILPPGPSLAFSSK